MRTSAPDLWRLPAGARFLRRQYDSEVVLFDHRSGLTHVLNETAELCLRVLETAPRSPSALARALSEAVAGAEATAEMLETLPDLLRQLDSLGLIEPKTD